LPTPYRLIERRKEKQLALAGGSSDFMDAHDDEPYDQDSRISQAILIESIFGKQDPMLRPIFVSLFSVSLAIAGCMSQNASDKKTDVSTPTAAMPAKPKSKQNAATPLQTQDHAAGETLVIEVDSSAKIGGVVRSIFQDTSGVLWIGGEGDLFRNDGKALTSYDIKDDQGKGVTIKRIIEDKEGNIWCGTTGGITRIDGESFTSFGEAHGLISHDVWSIAADTNGMIWVGTIEGVSRFDGKAFTKFALPEAEPDPTRGITSGKIVHCITVDRKGQMWFGTNGGAYKYDGRTLTNFSEKDGLSNNAVSSIIEDKSGSIWFGTTHKGICRYDGKVFTKFTEDGIVDGNEIWCVHEDQVGNIWFSGKRFGVYCYDGNSFTRFDEKDGLATPGIMCIFDDDKGRLWLGGVGGLFRYDGESFFNVKKDGPWK
jgi:ligand-binding sensor domain-containing protein